MTTSERRSSVLPVVAIVSAMISVAAVVVLVLVDTLNRAEDATKINRDGISCVLEQLSAHRQNNYAADQMDAQAHGKELMVPQPPAEAFPAELLKACDRFMEAPR